MKLFNATGGPMLKNAPLMRGGGEGSLLELTDT